MKPFVSAEVNNLPDVIAVNTLNSLFAIEAAQLQVADGVWRAVNVGGKSLDDIPADGVVHIFRAPTTPPLPPSAWAIRSRNAHRPLRINPSHELPNMISATSSLRSGSTILPTAASAKGAIELVVELEIISIVLLVGNLGLVVSPGRWGILLIVGLLGERRGLLVAATRL